MACPCHPKERLIKMKIPMQLNSSFPKHSLRLSEQVTEDMRGDFQELGLLAVFIL
jgi:hypothetical protein